MDSTTQRPETTGESKFVYRHRVRYHEADAQGFLFNSRYLEVADVAMTEFFRNLGLPYLELVAAGVDPSVVDARLRFRAPARFEDDLEVSVACGGVGTSSFQLTMEVRCAGVPVADIDLTYVNVDSASASSRPLAPHVAEVLRARASLHAEGLEIAQ